ncbi:hypothetical protein ACFFX0_28200 [Citricoccus parietis]|uniref:Uncharacterized protein n=1 Tax=Citricoccus parietis TaxID=592307 RepID=A0ABV5G7D3_9MICC
MPVHRRAADTAGRAQVLQSDRGEALVGEQPGGGLQQGLPAIGLGGGTGGLFGGHGVLAMSVG